MVVVAGRGVRVHQCSTLDEHTQGVWTLTYLNIGEAANPGPEYRRGMRVWSANATSLAERSQCMAAWGVDVLLAQETRLGAEAQRIMGASIA